MTRFDRYGIQYKESLQMVSNKMMLCNYTSTDKLDIYNNDSSYDIIYLCYFCDFTF